MKVNCPPAYTVPPLTANAFTAAPPKALGFQAVAVPVAASSAAIWFRDCPPITEKPPPAYTVPSLTASVDTMPLQVGFQAVADPVTASSAAIRLRVCPPIVLKVPPTYTVPPLTKSAATWSFAPGFQADTVWSAWMWAMFERGIPATWVKIPPTYHPPDPSGATA